MGEFNGLSIKDPDFVDKLNYVYKMATRTFRGPGVNDLGEQGVTIAPVADESETTPGVCDTVVVKLTGTATTNGYYNARIATYGVSMGDLAVPQVQLVDDSLAFNLYTETGHDLTLNTYHLGLIVQKTSTGKNLVAIQSVKLENCT